MSNQTVNWEFPNNLINHNDFRSILIFLSSQIPSICVLLLSQQLLFQYSWYQFSRLVFLCITYVRSDSIFLESVGYVFTSNLSHLRWKVSIPHRTNILFVLPEVFQLFQYTWPLSELNITAQHPNYQMNKISQMPFNIQEYVGVVVVGSFYAALHIATA